MKAPNSTTAIENWKKDLLSKDWDIALEAAEELGKIGGEAIVEYLKE